MMQPPDDHRVDRHAAPVVVVEHEFRRWQLLLVGPDRPVAVVQVELRHDVRELHVGFPVGVDRADVAPVGHSPSVCRRSCRRRLVREHAVRAHDERGMTSLPKSWLDAGSSASRISCSYRNVGVEHVDAHAGQRRVRAGRASAGGCAGFSAKLDDAAVGVDAHHAEASGLRSGTSTHATVRSASRSTWNCEHAAVVHLVDVVAGSTSTYFGLSVAQDVEVLVDRVGGALIPGSRRPAAAPAGSR